MILVRKCTPNIEGWWHGLRVPLIAMSVLFVTTLAALAQPYAYVAKIDSQDVAVIDTATQALLTTIPVGRDPDAVAVTPDGARAYVSNFLSDTVSVIDTRTNAVTATVEVGSGPVGIAVTPDGAFAYVTNRESNTVSVIRTATDTLVSTIAVGRGPDAIAITPDGALAYVTNSFSTSPGTVSVIDTATNGVASRIAVQRSPNRVAITPDGRVVYVTNFRSGNVSVIDTATNTVSTTIPLFGRPSGVTINPNGAYAYVVTLGGRVAVIETATNGLSNSLTVGEFPFGIALTRNGGTAYVANFLSASVSVVDLVNETEVGQVPVGDKPFAVAVNCAGSACTAPPISPRPTRIPTLTRTPTATRPPTSTPTPFPRPVTIQVGSTSGLPGQRATFQVSLQTAGSAVAGTQNDLAFDAQTRIAATAAGRPDCEVNPALGKNGSAFAFLPFRCEVGVDCKRIRALIVALDNADPIPDGSILYTCTVDIALDAVPGMHRLAISSVVASSPTGQRLGARGKDGQIVVVAGSDQSGARPLEQAARGGTGGGCQVSASPQAGGWLLLPAALLLWLPRQHGKWRRSAGEHHGAMG